MSARPCAVCRALGLRRPIPGCGYCREAAALRAAARPLTPLQLYRARMRRLAEIATGCGLHTIAGSLSTRSRMPRRRISRLLVEELQEWARGRPTWEPPLPGARAAALLLLSAADETAALLRAGGAS